jgi:hypothetical protein
VDVDNPRSEVDVAPFEREPLGRTKSGGSREEHHRPITGREMRGHSVELGPRLERALLPAPRRRIVHAELRRVDVDHPPVDRTREHLPERLRRVEAVAGRERDPPGGDLLRPEFAD